MKTEKTCLNCLKSKSISINGDFLCSLKGVVTGNYYCKKHKLMDFVSFNIIFSKCESCQYFIHKETNPKGKLGVCRLFTERLFNGSSKKACSKFRIDTNSNELSAI